MRSLVPLRLSARETVILDTPTRAATSAMVTCRAACAWPFFLGVSFVWAT